MDEAAFSAILDCVYATPASRSAWSGVLTALSAEFRGHCASLFQRDYRTGTLNLADHGVDAASYDEYRSQWDARNIFLLKAQTFTPGAIEPDRALLVRSEFLASDYYNGFMKPREMDVLLRLMVAADGVGRTAINLVRPLRRGEADESDLRMAQLVMPHLQRAVRIAREVEAAGLRDAAAVGMLDLNPVAILLLDSQRRLLFANRAALDMAARRQGFTLRRNRIEATRASEDAAMQALISSAFRSRGGAITLSCDAEERRLVATAGRVPVNSALFSYSAAVGYVLVCDPSTVATPSSLIPQKLFGLTGAETRICELLARGFTLEEIAVNLSIKISTARWHLHSLFQKTGVARQTQLVRLLTSFPWAVGDDLGGASERQSKGKLEQ